MIMILNTLPASYSRRERRMLRGKARMIWHRQVQQWHWISAAVCLAALLLFSVTGITLNHSGSIDSRPEVTTREGVLPPDLLEQLAAHGEAGKPLLPAAMSDWLSKGLDVDITRGSVE